MLPPAPPPYTLYHADYRDTLRRVAEAGGADLVATSPPYADARSYGMGCAWTDADYAALGDAVWGTLKPGGHALINVSAPVRDWASDGRGTERGLHAWRLLLDWRDRLGFRAVDVLAFGRMGTPGAYHGRFRADWEPLLWLQRPGADGYFDRWPLAEPAAGGGYAGAVAHTQGTDRVHVRAATGRAAEEGLRHRGTLWDYANVGAGNTGAPDLEAAGHPARWPYRLACDIVLCFSAPGALVVDPFCGAGTTAAAAIAHGRRFVGGDIGAREDGRRWVDVAGDILRARTAQQRLFASEPA